MDCYILWTVLLVIILLFIDVNVDYVVISELGETKNKSKY